MDANPKSDPQPDSDRVTFIYRDGDCSSIIYSNGTIHFDTTANRHTDEHSDEHADAADPQLADVGPRTDHHLIAEPELGATAA